MDGEWGEWQFHDGMGCPCVGMWTHRVYGMAGLDPQDGTIKSEKIGIPRNPKSRSWIWTDGYCRVIRYRIRRPRALLDMIERAASLPDLVPA